MRRSPRSPTRRSANAWDPEFTLEIGWVDNDVLEVDLGDGPVVDGTATELGNSND